jgi:hypothetical protein
MRRLMDSIHSNSTKTTSLTLAALGSSGIANSAPKSPRTAAVEIIPQ